MGWGRSFCVEELVPIAGYADRTITMTFPDLGDGVYVTLRNPKVMPPSTLRPRDVALDPSTGVPLNPADAEEAMFEMLAALVRDWHVYDATSEDDDQPRLGLPATPEAVKKLPMSIITAMTEKLAESVNPK